MGNRKFGWACISNTFKLFDMSRCLCVRRLSILSNFRKVEKNLALLAISVALSLFPFPSAIYYNPQPPPFPRGCPFTACLYVRVFIKTLIPTPSRKLP
jgi:hypothetical protein